MFVVIVSMKTFILLSLAGCVVSIIVFFLTLPPAPKRSGREFVDRLITDAERKQHEAERKRLEAEAKAKKDAEDAAWLAALLKQDEAEGRVEPPPVETTPNEGGWKYRNLPFLWPFY